MQTHVHPRTGAAIEGVRLPPGSIISKRDWYDSSDGKWRKAGHVAGITLERGCTTIWVRQPKKLSINACTLLDYLKTQPWGKKTCIGERDRTFYVIPSPTFNWDGRIDIEAMRVMHPECVQELIDNGHLAFSEEEATNWLSEYATVRDKHKNRVYTLTNERAQ